MHSLLFTNEYKMITISPVDLAVIVERETHRLLEDGLACSAKISGADGEKKVTVLSQRTRCEGKEETAC